MRAHTPKPPRYEALVARRDGSPDPTAAAVRASVRLGAGSYALLRLWALVKARLLSSARRGPGGVAAAATGRSGHRPLWRDADARLSSSLALILLLHRLLYRFLSRLRASLLADSARPFRRRNPRVAAALTSRLAPALGAALAGAALAVSPPDQLRGTVAVWAAFRAAEAAWDAAVADPAPDGVGAWLREHRPWWLGSWLVMPAACGQLLHAFAFDRDDCFPPAMWAFIRTHSPGYVPVRPDRYPAGLPWPTPLDHADALADASRLRWPPFEPPALFPDPALRKQASAAAAAAASGRGPRLTGAIARAAPLTDPAHPRIASLSCALLHPADPSCARAYAHALAASFPRMLRLMLVVHGALALPRVLAPLVLRRRPRPRRRRANTPASPDASDAEDGPASDDDTRGPRLSAGAALLAALESLPHALSSALARALRSALVLSLAITTAWGSICLFSAALPRSFLPTRRWLLSGALAGAWALLERGRPGGRAQALYAGRAAAESLWAVGRKKGWWRGVRGGDVALFVAAVGVGDVLSESAGGREALGGALGGVYRALKGEGSY